MKTKFQSGILALLLSLAINTSFAQTPVQWTRTLQFEGHWSGDATLNLGGQIFVVEYHVDFQPAVDGNVLTMNEWFSDAALGEFKGANLIGYSPYDDQIHWFSADNFGTAHEHTGSWSNPRRFNMVHQSDQGGLPFVEVIDFRLRANNQRIEVLLVATLGPDTVQTITGTLYKQNPNRTALVITDEERVNIFPNPTGGELFIESDVVMDELKIYNESGQLVYQSKPGSMEHELRLSTPGIYLVQVTTGNRTITKKVMMN